MILNKAQAEAVYSAMCELNNVGGRIRVDFERPLITVLEYPSGGVHVLRDVGGPGNSETYEGQSEFAAAYGLNSDETQSDVAAAAGGLTQTAIER